MKLKLLWRIFVNNFNLFCPLCKDKLNYYRLLSDMDILKCCNISIFISKEFNNSYIRKIDATQLYIDVFSDICLNIFNGKVINIKSKLDKIFCIKDSEYDFLLTQDKINQIFDLVKNIEENIIFE